jgi:hypothetical protein
MFAVLIAPAPAAAVNPSTIVSYLEEDACLGANLSNDVYTTPCNSIAAHRWDWDSTSRIVNKLTNRCLSANFNDAVYTVRCSLTETAHRWNVVLATGNGALVEMLQNQRTGRCLSTNFSNDVYTVASRGSADGHFWYTAFDL